MIDNLDLYNKRNVARCELESCCQTLAHVEPIHEYIESLETKIAQLEERLEGLLRNEK